MRAARSGISAAMRDIDPERVWEDVRRRLYPWKYGNCPCEKPDTQTRES